MIIIVVIFTHHNNYRCHHHYLISFLKNNPLHALTVFNEAAIASFPFVISHPSYLCKDCDHTASKHLPRTRTKLPAQRRPLTSVLYPSTIVHRHSPRKPTGLRRPHASPVPRAVLTWRRAPIVGHQLSCRVKRRRRDHHSSELNITSVNFYSSFFLSLDIVSIFFLKKTLPQPKEAEECTTTHRSELT